MHESNDHLLSQPESSSRIIGLETAVAHLQHELEQMHQVLLAVQADLNAAREKMAKLETKIVHTNEDSEQRNPSEERPPHY